MIARVFAIVAALALLTPLGVRGQQDPMAVAEGAQVYADSCSRCHQARPGSERTDLEWIAIIAHMRARANFTKSQAAAVLAFMQATNLPEAGAGMAALDGASGVVVPESLRAKLEEIAPTGAEAVGTGGTGREGSDGTKRWEGGSER